jgi:hypothetical protein
MTKREKKKKVEERRDERKEKYKIIKGNTKKIK